MKVSGLKTNEKKKTLLKKPFGLEQIAGAAIVMSKYLFNTQKYSDHFGKSLGNYSRRAIFLCYENVTVKDAAFFTKYIFVNDTFSGCQSTPKKPEQAKRLYIVKQDM